MSINVDLIRDTCEPSKLYTHQHPDCIIQLLWLQDYVDWKMKNSIHSSSPFHCLYLPNKNSPAVKSVRLIRSRLACGYMVALSNQKL